MKSINYLYSIILFIFLIVTQKSFAQNYDSTIIAFRKNYVHELLTDERAPIKGADTNKLRFYKPNKKYAVKAIFKPVIDTVGFIMLTVSGKQKKHFVYGVLHFNIGGKAQTLHVYKSEKLMTTVGYEDYLFIPFFDATNYGTTFGGGRYIDMREKDIINNTVVLDFNKCYNPYCAFASGFNCSIPPQENKLKVKILAGEKLPVGIIVEHK